MNHEPLPPPAADQSLTSFGGVALPPTAPPGSDDAFQELLVALTARATEQADAGALIQLLCRATREFFGISGVYFWRAQTGDELIGQQGDGKLVELFVGLRLRAAESAVAADIFRRQRLTIANHLDSITFPEAARLQARSLVAAPIVVFNEVIGAVTFLHDAEESFFTEEMAGKAKILAGQLETLLEAIRLTEASREEHRRAEILADVAQALHGTPDVSSVIEALADRLRLLLRAQLVCVLLGREGPFELRAVSAETPQIANSVRARHDRKTVRFAADLAQRAVTAGEPITLAIGGDVHSLGSLAPPGMLIAAPLRTSRTRGAILVYPRLSGAFTAEEKSLVAAIAGFGAVAVAHAELYATAHAQAHELHQLLEISSSLTASGDLEKFLQAFVVRAADFLGFGRCFIGLLEGDAFHLRYVVNKGEPRRLDVIFPEGVATRALRAKEVFWTDDIRNTPGANLDVILKYEVRQCLVVPLLGADGNLLGMFGMLDRLDGTGISHEDIRRARALGNQVAVVLEVARELHLSEEHRRRAEALIELAGEINGTLHLPEFSRRFVCRAAELTHAKAGVLVVFQQGRPQAMAFYPDADAGSTTTGATTPGAITTDSAAQPPPRSDDARQQPVGDEGSEERNEERNEEGRDEQRTEFSLVSAVRGAKTPENQGPQRVLASQLRQALADVAARHTEAVLSGSATELLGSEIALATGWSDCTIVRLPRANGELAGVLCLAGRGSALADEDRIFLEAMASHGAMALENARLFTAVEQANRQWLEIFDAITDFIVAHDEADKILRVNRSLATMIGVPPAELIGVNMRALMALTGDVASYSCHLPVHGK